MNGVKGLLLTSLIPTLLSVMTPSLPLHPQPGKQIAILIIVEYAGKNHPGRNIVQSIREIQAFSYRLDKLAAGVYHPCCGNLGQAGPNTLNFIKQ